MSCHPFCPSGLSSPSPTEDTGGLWVSRAAGLGFCEAQKGGRCIIARCFDHVSGNYCWVRTETYLLKEYFPLAPTPLGKLMLRRGWGVGPAPHSPKQGSVVPKSHRPWALGFSGFRRDKGQVWEPSLAPGRSSWHSPPAPLGLPFLVMTERNSAGFPQALSLHFLRSGMSHPPPTPHRPSGTPLPPRSPRPVLPDV